MKKKLLYLFILPLYLCYPFARAQDVNQSDKNQTAHQNHINMREDCVKKIAKIWDKLFHLSDENDRLVVLDGSLGAVMNVRALKAIAPLAETLRDCKPYFEGGANEVIEKSYKQVIEERRLRKKLELYQIKIQRLKQEI